MKNHTVNFMHNSMPYTITYVPLNFIIRVLFFFLCECFCVALPLRLDKWYVAQWWVLFLPLYGILAVSFIFTLDSLRRFRKHFRHSSFTFRLYGFVYHTIYAVAIIGVLIWIWLLTQKLDGNSDMRWDTVFVPLSVSSGIVFFLSLLLFFLSTCDLGSLVPFSERLAQVAVSRTGYILFFSLIIFVFSLVISSELVKKDLSHSFWGVFGVFWFAFGLLLLSIAFVLVRKCVRKATEKRKKSLVRSEDDEADGIEEDQRYPQEEEEIRLISDKVYSSRPDRLHRRRQCVWVALILWGPLCLFVVLLAAHLNGLIDWSWFVCFIPLIIAFGILLLWTLSRGGMSSQDIVLLDVVWESLRFRE